MGKNYIVRTGAIDNEMALLSTKEPSFETTEFNAAVEVFRNEILELESTLTKGLDLGYSPTNSQLANAIYCTLKGYDGEKEVFSQTSEDYYEDKRLM